MSNGIRPLGISTHPVARFVSDGILIVGNGVTRTYGGLAYVTKFN